MDILTKLKAYPEYKDSGVEWLGEIPQEWQLKRFKHFYHCSMGETILANDLSEEGFPVYSATEEDVFFGKVENRNVELSAGDLVIPARGNSIGFPKIVTQESTTTQTTIYAKMANKIHPKFSYYYLLGCKPYIFRFVQTAIPQITVDEVKNNLFLQPSEDEQIAIANFLDDKVGKIDAVIAQKEQLIQLLNERKQITIQNAVTKGLNPEAPMRDSGIEWIGKIPEHWEMKKLKHIFSEKKITHDPRLPCGSISFGKVVKKPDEKISTSTKASYQVLNKGEFLVNPLNLNYDLKSLRIGLSGMDVVVSSGYIVLKSLGENKRYLSYMMHRYDVAHMKLLGSGVRQTLNFNHIANSLLPIPSEDEQKQIVSYLEQASIKFEAAVASNKSSIEKLKEFKASLINSAVTGKIYVSNYGL